MREEEMIIAIAGMVTAVLILRLITRAVTRMFCHWRDVALKAKLVDAGMDRIQIEHVVLVGRYEQTCSKELASAKHRPKAVYATR
jgi:hypothetical protein